jgi:NAD(P)-dependent dehydrogenase (short-subunit alcohol dehydrogenase family)
LTCSALGAPSVPRYRRSSPAAVTSFSPRQSTRSPTASSTRRTRHPRQGVEQLGRALRAELAPHGATAGVLYPGWLNTPLTKAAFGGSAVATELFRHAWPAPLRTPITRERVAAATVRGIERRSARIIVPGRWIPFFVLRGIVNPLVDLTIEHDPKIRPLVLELERQATAHRDQAVHESVLHMTRAGNE